MHRPRWPWEEINRHPWREIAVGVAGQVLNPFAQLTRLAAPPSPTKRIRTVDDIPERWRKKQKPNIIPIEDDESFDNSPPTEQEIMDGDGSGKDSGLKETPVDDPFNIQRGPPDYTFATLPYVQDWQQSGSSYMLREHQFRMTSPYDVSPSFNTLDINSGSGGVGVGIYLSDSSDPVVTSARWFSYYSSTYKYYHVIAARWHVTIENQMTQPLWVHQYYQNNTGRPVTASNLDMMLWKDVKSHYVGPVATAISSFGTAERQELPAGENIESNVPIANVINYESANHVVARGASNILQLSGEYRPGDYEREIKLDNVVENWTLVNANPALSERLVLRVKPQNEALETNSVNSSGQQLSYRIFTRIEYLVEFKELVDGLKYPINTQPAVLTVNQTT